LDTTRIIDDLKAQRERLDRAIAALQGGSTRRRGRPRSSPAKVFQPKRRMSAAAKKKISEANKKRWAAWRKKNS
jgi:hypothetical protein